MDKLRDGYQQLARMAVVSERRLMEGVEDQMIGRAALGYPGNLQPMLNNCR